MRRVEKTRRKVRIEYKRLEWNRRSGEEKKRGVLAQPRIEYDLIEQRFIRRKEKRQVHQNIWNISNFIQKKVKVHEKQRK